MKTIFKCFITMLCLIAMSGTLISLASGVHVRYNWSVLQIAFIALWGFFVPLGLILFALNDKRPEDV